MDLLRASIGRAKPEIAPVRISQFESFGRTSNGMIQPIYLLSGSIFPLKDIVGGMGFLDIPRSLCDELHSYGIHTIGRRWVVELPVWLEAIVRANPISYQLDVLRLALLDFRQLPLSADIAVCSLFPLAMIILESRCIGRLRHG